MSYFTISNLNRSEILNSKEIGRYELSIDSIEFVIKSVNSFNSLRFQQDNYSLYILGNPIVKKSFYDFINSLELNTLLVDDKVCFDVFNQLNGITALLVINEKVKKLSIFTDPLGFFPIFLIENENGFLITNDLKQIHNYNSFNVEWDLESIYAYYTNGHFISGRTWFKNCLRLNPSTCLSIDLSNENILSRRYWNWSEVKKSLQTKDELVVAYYNAFINLFREVDFSNLKLGIGLSGGLDSRWVVEECSKLSSSIETYTFSEGNSIDLTIAKRISHLLHLSHHTYRISRSNWFKDRLEQFWECDGLIPINHFHEGNIYDVWKAKYDLIATGFYGGGIYSTGNQLNQEINSGWANKLLKLCSINSNINDSHYNIKSLDPYLSWQRIAQCGAIQVYTMTKSLKVFIPFYNMNWMKINYSIDEKWQEYAAFYLHVLNVNLPKNLMSIMWQRTLCKANHVKFNVLIQELSINRIIKKVLRFLGYESNFVDYRMLNQDIEDLDMKLDIPDFIKTYQASTIDSKMRKASIILWYNMWKRKSSNVI